MTTLPSAESLGTFFEANELLGDVSSLRSRLDEDGYLFVRDILPVDALREVRDDITRVLAEIGWIRGDAERLEAEAIAMPCREGEPRFFEALDRIIRLESFHHLAHEPALSRLMQTALGETAFPHPLGIVRLVFPQNPEITTPPHQDYPNNQGTERLTAAWIPLADCPIEHGPVAVLAGSHKLGRLPLQFHLGAGSRTAVLPPETAEMQWLSADFRLGDVLLFPALTIHRALENKHPSKMRLSTDWRFQLEGEALTEPSLRPHFDRISWGEIYKGWRSPDLQYYWKRKTYQVVPWDEAKHALPPEATDQAMRQEMTYQVARQRRFSERVASTLERHAKVRPEHPALLFAERRYTYAEFNARANQLAHALEGLGLRRGDVLSVWMDPRPEYLFTALGANKLGAVVDLPNTAVAAGAMATALGVTEPSWIVVGEEKLAALGEIGELPVPADHVLVWSDGDDLELPDGFRSLGPLVDSSSAEDPPPVAVKPIHAPAFYLATAGTDGNPKAVKLSNPRALRTMRAFGGVVAETTSDDVIYSPGLPFSHATGTLVGLGMALMEGATLAFRGAPSDGEYWEDVRRFEATVGLYSKELCRRLLDAPVSGRERGHRLRLAVGFGLRAEDWPLFMERFEVPEVREFYASGEANADLFNLEGVPGMLGELQPGQAIVAIHPEDMKPVQGPGGHLLAADVGEVGLLIGQINLMNGFNGYVDPAETAATILDDPLGDGRNYFDTGDIVRKHPRGLVSFVRRRR